MRKISKIKKVSAADLVFDRLKSYILDHSWPVGEKIPSEIEISKQLGVNRLTTRIALQRLGTLGLLDIRVGDGTYVREFDMNSHIAKLTDFYVTEKNIEEVVEYRRSLMLSCIPLAIKRASEDEIEHFKELTIQFRNELDSYYNETDTKKRKKIFEQNIDTVVEMNVAICSMAHNDLFNYAFVLSIEPMRRHMTYNASKRIEKSPGEVLNKWVPQWEQMYMALKDRDVEKSIEIMNGIIGP